MASNTEVKKHWSVGDLVATREAYGQALLALGKENNKVVVLDADLSGSTQTKFFAKEFPERFFNMGIAENNMMGVAAGLARAGKIPFASSFAMFATGRAWEFVRNSIAHNHLPVKVCATHSGLTVGEDGASHQIIEDIAIMRAIPTMLVLVPADAEETYQMIKASVHFDQPCYIRLGRAKTPVIFSSDYKFTLGKAAIIKPGRAVTLISCGVVVHRAMEAASILSKNNIDAEVINVSSIKPIDAETICQSVNKTGSVITIEEHNIHGGLGDAVASVLAENSNVKFRLKRMGVQDQFGQSGEAMQLLDFYGLAVQDIVKLTQSMIGQ